MQFPFFPHGLNTDGFLFGMQQRPIELEAVVFVAIL